MDIEEDLVGAFFMEYGQMQEVMSVRSKTGLVTGVIILWVTMSHKIFLEEPDTFMCWG